MSQPTVTFLFPPCSVGKPQQAVEYVKSQHAEHDTVVVELWMSSFQSYTMAGCRLRQVERFKRSAEQAGRSLGQASEAAVEEMKMRAKLFDNAQQRTEELRERTSSYVDSMCAPWLINGVSTPCMYPCTPCSDKELCDSVGTGGRASNDMRRWSGSISRYQSWHGQR